jgi:hypothetical protein
MGKEGRDLPPLICDKIIPPDNETILSLILGLKGYDGWLKPACVFCTSHIRFRNFSTETINS